MPFLSALYPLFLSIENRRHRQACQSVSPSVPSSTVKFVLPHHQHSIGIGPPPPPFTLYGIGPPRSRVFGERVDRSIVVGVPNHSSRQCWRSPKCSMKFHSETKQPK
ncbi:hypothetical protein L1887_29077 [Cichorium endivia]|nr:hypothetical protein L1887_29077 [Cichorium endivia]